MKRASAALLIICGSMLASDDDYYTPETASFAYKGSAYTWLTKESESKRHHKVIQSDGGLENSSMQLLVSVEHSEKYPVQIKLFSLDADNNTLKKSVVESDIDLDTNSQKELDALQGDIKKAFDEVIIPESEIYTACLNTTLLLHQMIRYQKQGSSEEALKIFNAPRSECVAPCLYQVFDYSAPSITNSCKTVQCHENKKGFITKGWLSLQQGWKNFFGK